MADTNITLHSGLVEIHFLKSTFTTKAAHNWRHGCASKHFKSLIVHLQSVGYLRNEIANIYIIYKYVQVRTPLLEVN